MAFLAAFSALTWLGVFLAGVLVPPLLETDLASSVSAATVSEVTLRALFILSTFGVAAEEREVSKQRIQSGVLGQLIFMMN